MEKKQSRDKLSRMENLLEKAMQPGSKLYQYMMGELIDPDNPGKPDAKPLRDVLAVLKEIRELREENREQSIVVRFEDPEGYSE